MLPDHVREKDEDMEDDIDGVKDFDCEAEEVLEKDVLGSELIEELPVVEVVKDRDLLALDVGDCEKDTDTVGVAEEDKDPVSETEVGVMDCVADMEADKTPLILCDWETEEETVSVAVGVGVWVPVTDEDSVGLIVGVKEGVGTKDEERVRDKLLVVVLEIVQEERAVRVEEDDKLTVEESEKELLVEMVRVFVKEAPGVLVRL
eukprot:RCo017708